MKPTNEMGIQFLIIICAFFPMFQSNGDAWIAERFGTEHFNVLSKQMDRMDQLALTSGALCARIIIANPVDKYPFSYNEISKSMLKSIIVNPIKSFPHSKPSPMTTFFYFPEIDNIHVCTLGDGDNYSPNDHLRLISDSAVTWMQNVEDVFSGSSAFGASETPGSDIVIPITLKKDTEYAVFYGIIHTGDFHLEVSDIENHFDTAWVKSIDTQSQKITMVWSDNKQNMSSTINSKVNISVVAIPLTNNNSNGPVLNKDYTVGKVPFTWPIDRSARGYCINIPFENKFEYPPSVFTSVEMNSSNRNLSIATWVQSVTEYGCQVCASLLRWHTQDDIDWMINNSGSMYFHYLAFTKIYSASQLENATPPSRVVLSLGDIDFSKIKSKADQEQLLRDVFSIYDFSDFFAPYEMMARLDTMEKIENPNAQIESRAIYFYSNVGDFSTHYSFNDVLGHYSTRIDIGYRFFFQEGNSVHSAFQEKYAIRDSQNVSASSMTRPEYEFSRANYFLNDEVIEPCTEKNCNKLVGGQVIVERKVKDKAFDRFDGTSQIPMAARTLACNAKPCEMNGEGLEIFFSDTENYHFRNSGANYGISTVWIIIIVVLVLVFTFLFGFTCYYFKRTIFKRKSTFSKAEAHKPMQSI